MLKIDKKNISQAENVHANDYDKLIHQNNVCSVCLTKCQSSHIYFCHSPMTQQNEP